MDDITIRSNQLREQLAAANARIRELEDRLRVPPITEIRPPASADTAKAWLQRSLTTSSYEQVVEVADRLAAGVVALDVELRDVKARLDLRERSIEYLSRSSLESPR